MNIQLCRWQQCWKRASARRVCFVKYFPCFAVVLDSAGAVDYHHIRYLFHSYNVRDDVSLVVAVVTAAAVEGFHVSVVFVVAC